MAPQCIVKQGNQLAHEHGLKEDSCMHLLNFSNISPNVLDPYISLINVLQGTSPLPAELSNKAHLLSLSQGQLMILTRIKSFKSDVMKVVQDIDHHNAASQELKVQSHICL